MEAWRASHQQRRIVLEVVQIFSAQHAHSYQRQIYAAVSRRVHLPLEPPRDVERDVRPPDCVGVVANFLMAASTSLQFAGPMPRASSWATNSRKRPVFK